MKNINSLYLQNADLYNAISNDRDFCLQTETLIKTTSSNCKRVVELFSGQGMHGLELRKMGFDCVAVDSSLDMKRSAIDAGNYDDNSYIIGTLPFFQVPQNFSNFDAFFLLRYSCGYLNILEFNELILQCKSAANKGASLFIESHSMDTIYQGFQNLSIVTRTTSLGNDDVSCSWPSEQPVFDPYSHTANLKVSIRVNNDIVNYISRENFHSFELIQFLAIKNGLKITHHSSPDYSKAFPGSIISQIFF
ncbi:hypothetical protein KCG43_09885 [Photobacterium sp. WH24]|nr:hypothetical protein [Photobacterium sp. WH24]